MLEERMVSALLMTKGERRNKARQTKDAEGDRLLSEVVGLLLRNPLTIK